MQSSNGAILGDGTHVCDDVDTTSFAFKNDVVASHVLAQPSKTSKAACLPPCQDLIKTEKAVPGEVPNVAEDHKEIMLPNMDPPNQPLQRGRCD